MKWRCTIHSVQFDAEAMPDCKAADREFVQIPQCPVCYWKDRQAMQSELRRLLAQRDLLVSAIELKQQSLVVRL